MAAETEQPRVEVADQQGRTAGWLSLWAGSQDGGGLGYAPEQDHSHPGSALLSLWEAEGCREEPELGSQAAPGWDPGSAVKPKWRPFTPGRLHFLVCEMGSKCECPARALGQCGGASVQV